MIAAMDKLPTINRFVCNIAADLTGGRCVLAQLPRYPQVNIFARIESEVSQLCKDPVSIDIRELSLDADLLPGRVFCSQYGLPDVGSDASSIRILLECEDFLDTIPLLDIPAGFQDDALRKLLSFLDVYQAAIKERDHTERTPICCISRGTPIVGIQSDVHLAIHRWAGVVSPVDIQAVLQSSLKEDFSLCGMVHRQIIQELAGFDWSLAENLARHSLNELLSPKNLLIKFGDSLGLDGDAHWDPKWLNGGVDKFGGTDFLHSSYLAVTGRDKEISRRIWKAQLKIVYPLLEELRVAISSKHSRLFNKNMYLLQSEGKNNQEPVEDSSELEIAQLYYIARRSTSIAPSVARHLKEMREARNALAHLEPISSDCLKRLQESMRAFGINQDSPVQ